MGNSGLQSDSAVHVGAASGWRWYRGGRQGGWERTSESWAGTHQGVGVVHARLSKAVLGRVRQTTLLEDSRCLFLPQVYVLPVGSGLLPPPSFPQGPGICECLCGPRVILRWSLPTHATPSSRSLMLPVGGGFLRPPLEVPASPAGLRVEFSTELSCFSLGGGQLHGAGPQTQNTCFPVPLLVAASSLPHSQIRLHHYCGPLLHSHLSTVRFPVWCTPLASQHAVLWGETHTTGIIFKGRPCSQTSLLIWRAEDSPIVQPLGCSPGYGTWTNAFSFL